MTNDLSSTTNTRALICIAPRDGSRREHVEVFPDDGCIAGCIDGQPHSRDPSYSANTFITPAQLYSTASYHTGDEDGDVDGDDLDCVHS